MSEFESYRTQLEHTGDRWPHDEFSREYRAAGLQWRVQVAGSGPDIVLLHGAGGSTHSWAGLFGPLSEEFRVFAPDLPGHAFTSALPADRSRLSDMAKAVTRLLDAADVKPAGIVTHSAGAAVAVQMMLSGDVKPGAWAGLAPSLVRPSRGAPPRAVQELLAPVFRSSGLSLVASALGGRRLVTDLLLESTGSAVPDWSRTLYRRLMANPAHVGSVLRLMASWDPDPVARRLGEVGVPGLVVAGQADQWIPLGDVNAAVEALSEVEFHVVPGLGHLLHEEAPQQVFELLAPFLRTHLLAAGTGGDGGGP